MIAVDSSSKERSLAGPVERRISLAGLPDRSSAPSSIHYPSVARDINLSQRQRIHRRRKSSILDSVFSASSSSIFTEHGGRKVRRMKRAANRGVTGVEGGVEAPGGEFVGCKATEESGTRLSRKRESISARREQGLKRKGRERTVAKSLESSPRFSLVHFFHLSSPPFDPLLRFPMNFLDTGVISREPFNTSTGASKFLGNNCS